MKMIAPSGREFEVFTVEEVAILKRLGWKES